VVEAFGEHDVSAGDHRASAAAHGGRLVDRGLLHPGSEVGVGAQLGEFVGDVLPPHAELGCRVLGVVRIVEVHRRERAVRRGERPKSVGFHDPPFVRTVP
jgi:hypothetical protein